MAQRMKWKKGGKLNVTCVGTRLHARDKRWIAQEVRRIGSDTGTIVVQGREFHYRVANSTVQLQLPVAA